jgi:hypothetical protein
MDESLEALVSQTVERSEAANNHVKHLVSNEIIKVKDGELLLSKIAIGCIEIAYLLPDGEIEPDVKLTLNSKINQLNKVLKICESY